jgi:hypothetical protein
VSVSGFLVDSVVRAKGEQYIQYYGSADGHQRIDPSLITTGIRGYHMRNYMTLCHRTSHSGTNQRRERLSSPTEVHLAR